jgi:hypothetical protein
VRALAPPTCIRRLAAPAGPSDYVDTARRNNVPKRNRLSGGLCRTRVREQRSLRRLGEVIVEKAKELIVPLDLVFVNVKVNPAGLEKS